MCGESAAGCEFPVSSCDRASSELCSVDYGQFLSFLETDKGKIVCLQQGNSSFSVIYDVINKLITLYTGHDQRVVYDSPCFPVAPPGVCKLLICLLCLLVLSWDAKLYIIL